MKKTAADGCPAAEVLLLWSVHLLDLSLSAVECRCDHVLRRLILEAGIRINTNSVRNVLHIQQTFFFSLENECIA